MFQRDVVHKPNLFLYSFSAVNNTRSLFRTSNSRTNHFAALDTIKFMFVVYIHLYHYYNYLATVGLVTLKRIFTTYPVTGFRDDRYTWFRLTLPFDAILVISGLIVAFSMQRKLKLCRSNESQVNQSQSQSHGEEGNSNNNKNKKFNYLNYALKLWIKFAITYGGSILFIYVLPTITTGPIWDHGMTWLNGCLNLKTVLLGFLFISNYNVQLGASINSPGVLPYVSVFLFIITELF